MLAACGTLPCPTSSRPLLSSPTPDLFYLRLHGRNLKGWRSGNKQQQFDYDYTLDELREWSRDRLPQICRANGKGVILFNNQVAGQAVRNARSMA